MTPEVSEAIDEIRSAFHEHDIEVIPETQGGAYVIVSGLAIGGQYDPGTSWIGFLISFQYPDADVYPHFMDAGVCRLDGEPLGEGMTSPHTWQNRTAIQISRRSNRWNPACDTAALKLEKVLQWLRTR